MYELPPNWVCPVCRDICNCSAANCIRRKQDWGTTGQLATEAISLSYKSVSAGVVGCTLLLLAAGLQSEVSRQCQLRCISVPANVRTTFYPRVTTISVCFYPATLPSCIVLISPRLPPAGGPLPHLHKHLRAAAPRGSSAAGAVGAAGHGAAAAAGAEEAAAGVSWGRGWERR